jgi:hypothetical protein
MTDWRVGQFSIADHTVKWVNFRLPLTVAVLLADLFVQACCAGYPADLVARVVMVAAGATLVVFNAKSVCPICTNCICGIFRPVFREQEKGSCFSVQPAGQQVCRRGRSSAAERRHSGTGGQGTGDRESAASPLR